MSLKLPFFSCVIPVKGERPFFKEALASLAAQDLGEELEVIVQDGTTEDTECTEIPEGLNVQWFREEDVGQSDALNRGFAKAKGEWLFWLNADDVLLPGALKKTLDRIDKIDRIEWIAGDTAYIDEKSKVLEVRTDAKWRPWFGKKLSVWTGGPSAFFRRELWERRGGFDADLKYVMDIDLWTRWAKAGARFESIGDYVWGFRVHSGSKTAGGGNLAEHRAERAALMLRLGISHEALWRNLTRAASVLDGSWLKRKSDSAKLCGRRFDWSGKRRVVHFCAGLQFWNGMANTARQFVEEDLRRGDDSRLTDNPHDIAAGVDVVMVHGAWLPVLWRVAKKAKAVGARLLIRPAGSYDPVRLSYHAWKKRLASVFERRMLRRTDALLATCEAEAEWIRAYLGKKCPPVELTDLKRFFKLESGGVGELRVGELHLLYLGRRHPLKGVEYLESAVNELRNSQIPTLSTPPLLRIVSNAFGEELEKVWEWCDVLVLPTLSENFGRVVAEALERGKRVITTDGAPAWGERELGSGGVEVGYGGRLVYLKGYRDGTDEQRVVLLKNAIERMCS